MPQQNWANLAKAKDVAQIAKVSTSTVSRVFDPKWDGKVKEETRQRILKAAEQLGYTPNAIARSLNANKTNIVAVVLGEDVGYFFSEIFFKLTARLQQSGRQVLTFETDPVLGIEHIVRQVHQYRVDAIIIMASATTSYIEDYFYECGTPVILFNRKKFTSAASSVRSAVEEPIRQMVDLLVKSGHRTFAHISGEGHGSNEYERTDCFVDEVQKKGGRLLSYIKGNYTYACGYESAQRILSECGGVDALFCSEDSMAIGAIDAFRAAGLCVPKDVSVVGFDDIKMASMAGYSLTSIAHNHQMLLDETLRVLDMVMEDASCSEERRIPMELVVRGSVRTM